MEISDPERIFIQEGFSLNFRSDSRSNHTFRPYSITKSVIPSAWGSSKTSILQGDKETDIIVSIKCKAVKLNPDTPLIEYFLESTQTGNSLFTKDKQAQKLRAFIKETLNTHLSQAVDPESLIIRPKETAWKLFIDVLVMEEFSLSQIQPISVGIRAALEDLRLPHVVASYN